MPVTREVAVGDVTLCFIAGILVEVKTTGTILKIA